MDNATSEVITAHCEKHGYYECRKVDWMGVHIEGSCPECLREHEEKQAQILMGTLDATTMHDMNIEPRYYEATLDNFDAYTIELQKAKDAIEKLVRGEILQVIMAGKNGTGKTHLAVGAIKKTGGKIYTMYEIATRIRSTYSSFAHENEASILSELAEMKMLVIDELGRSKGSEAEANWISYILDKRHSRYLPTIIISNTHMRRDCPNNGCPQCLENYLSNDVMSRLTENGVLLRFTGEDYRARKQ